MIMCLMLHAVKDVGIAPADVRTHVIFYALYSYNFYWRRQEKAVYMAIHVTCTTTSHLIIIGQMMVNELAEPLFAPNGWRPPASRTPANNGVPAVGIFALYGAVSSGGITAFVPD